MNVAALLRRLEAAAEKVRLAGKRCPDCGGPVPSLIAVLVLGPQGVVNHSAQCSTCAGAGGGGGLAIDPRTGRPEYAPKVILLDLEFEDWWEAHGAEERAGALGLTLRYHRALSLTQAGSMVTSPERATPQAKPASGPNIDSIVPPPDWD